ETSTGAAGTDAGSASKKSSVTPMTRATSTLNLSIARARFMTPDSLFGTSLRRDPSQPAAPTDPIEGQLRERLEEAVDFVCLGALVERRRALGLPAPRADSASDRAEFTESVRAFLADLRAAIEPDLDQAQRRKVTAADQAPGDEMHRLLGVHVALARELPDYWQLFEAARATYPAARVQLGHSRAGMLGRLFGRG